MSEDSIAFENGQDHDFDTTQKEMLKNRNLNPQPGRVRGIVQRTAAAVGITIGSLLGSTAIENKVGDDVRDAASGMVDSIQDTVSAAQDKANEVDDIVTGDENIGKPYGDGIPLVLNLVKVEDGKEDLVKPTFRIKPSKGGEELSPQELAEKGLSPSLMEEIITRPVLGGEYAANPLLDQSQVKAEVDGKEYGIWQEILVAVPEFGGYKPSGVFVAGNVVDWETSKKMEVGEGQEIKIIDPAKAPQE